MKQQNTPYSTAARYNEALSPEEIEIKCGTYSDTYTGSREDLIKAGLATADMFPVSLKRKKILNRSWHNQTRGNADNQTQTGRKIRINQISRGT